MMREQSFYDWLLREVLSSRIALISLYENRDRLLYIEAPALRKQYLGIFGEEENAVLQSELETALLRRKIELIRTAINRREVIDLDAIDSQIKAERDQRLSDLEKSDMTLNELPQLTEQQMQDLQNLYHDITRSFHPAMNADMTETQKELYRKAIDAYKMQDVDALRIIHDCLFVRDVLDATLQASPVYTEEEHDERKDYHTYASALTTDYTLAKRLYPYFIPLEEDTVINNTLLDCTAKRKEVEEEIAKIKAGFPFNAVETMNDNEKTEEYRAELKMRSRRAEAEKCELLETIEKLTEGRING